ncbi:uncharacterized protein LOC132552678 [Ylistrum balloti]|uniref:uncharacterized protein LOC132552678 n=1 Tax=Ylistrum balloti TaxID=509963 RepID=UPI002905D5BF|nr:uncharacterized protein LOC132552678 [Ylistrum balloti]
MMMFVPAVLVSLFVYTTAVDPTISPNEQFLLELQVVHSSHTFHHLPATEQLILVELVAAAKTNTVTHYVDRVGFDRILQFLDHVNQINQHEAHRLEKYLIQEFGEEETSTAATVRRDLQSVLATMTSNDAFQHLSSSDQNLMLDLAKAAEHGNVTALIDQVGYSKVLALVEHITAPAETHTFLQYLASHMAKELGHHHHNGPIAG